MSALLSNCRRRQRRFLRAVAIEATRAADGRGQALVELEALARRRLASLHEARDFVAGTLAGYLETMCVLDPQTLEPIRASLRDQDRPHIELVEQLLARIDEALS